MSDESIDNLLARYLAGECDAAEVAQAEAWMTASEENRAYFEKLKRTWEISASSEEKHSFDADAAWTRMKVRMHAPKEEEVKPRKNLLRIAASVGLLIVIGAAVFLYFNRTEPPKKMFAAWTPIGDSSVATLPDGTTVTMNRNTIVTFPSYFPGNTREVTLEGEAFFDVQHDTKHPFIIHAGALDVKVVGTSFDVRAYPGSDSVRVSVTTGKVQCSTGNDSVMLTPGEIVVYNTHDHTLRKATEGDPNTLAYRTRIFQFNNTSLPDMVRMLNEAYGVNIVLRSNQLNNCKFGSKTNFNNVSLDTILGVFSDAFGITIEKKGQVIYLDGQGCQ